MQRIPVLLADDHTIVREGLRKMLEFEDDLEVVGEARNGRQAVALAVSLHPAVVLMDIAMPRLNGLEATRQVHKAMPDVKVLILSAHHDEAYVARAIEYGAVGFLLKQSCAHEVCQAIREVNKGKTFFPSSLATSIEPTHLPESGHPGLPNKKHAELTSREVEVLQRIAEGAANKQVADELAISIKTVEKHRARLMTKLDIHDTAGLTRYAIAAGMIESNVQSTIL